VTSCKNAENRDVFADSTGMAALEVEADELVYPVKAKAQNSAFDIG
jgi:hypothetical protein